MVSVFVGAVDDYRLIPKCLLEAFILAPAEFSGISGTKRCNAVN